MRSDVWFRRIGAIRKSALAARIELTVVRGMTRGYWLRHGVQRRRLTARMQVALTGTGSAMAPGSAARRCLEARAVSDFAISRPYLWPALVSADQHRLEDLRKDDRGMIIASIHSPTMWLSAAVASAQLGLDIMWAAGDVAFDVYSPDDPPQRGEIRSAAGGATLIRSVDAYLLMRQRLREGGMVGLLFDVPGDVEVRMLGKRTFIHPWVAKLARYHGVPILPVIGVWSGAKMTLQPGGLVEPREGETVRELCQRTATAVEELWLRFPDHWAPYTRVLWPYDTEQYTWAFDDGLPED